MNLSPCKRGWKIVSPILVTLARVRGNNSIVLALPFFLTLPSHDSFAQTDMSDGFDYPVGKPDGNGYYVYTDFRDVDHLGEDWNANSGGDTGIGDAVYAVSNARLL